LGEVAGLDASVKEAARKLVSLDRLHDRQTMGQVNLGIPVIGNPGGVTAGGSGGTNP
jgi:hypothetical protein